MEKLEKRCVSCGGKGYHNKTIGSGGNRIGCRIERKECHVCGPLAKFLEDFKLKIDISKEVEEDSWEPNITPLAPPLQ